MSSCPAAEPGGDDGEDEENVKFLMSWLGYEFPRLSRETTNGGGRGVALTMKSHLRAMSDCIEECRRYLNQSRRRLSMSAKEIGSEDGVAADGRQSQTSRRDNETSCDREETNNFFFDDGDRSIAGAVTTTTTTTESSLQKTADDHPKRVVEELLATVADLRVSAVNVPSFESDERERREQNLKKLLHECFVIAGGATTTRDLTKPVAGNRKPRKHPIAKRAVDDGTKSDEPYEVDTQRMFLFRTQRTESMAAENGSDEPVNGPNWSSNGARHGVDHQERRQDERLPVEEVDSPPKDARTEGDDDADGKHLDQLIRHLWQRHRKNEFVIGNGSRSTATPLGDHQTPSAPTKTTDALDETVVDSEADENGGGNAALP